MEKSLSTLVLVCLHLQHGALSELQPPAPQTQAEDVLLVCIFRSALYVSHKPACPSCTS